MRTLRILVVDDQEHMRELLVEALSADGHGVDAAENGMAALKLFEAQPYDLVVSDLQMPQMDGPKLYGELQKRRPEGMPAWGGRIADDQIWRLVAYVRTLDKGHSVSTENFTGKTIARSGH